MSQSQHNQATHEKGPKILNLSDLDLRGEEWRDVMDTGNDNSFIDEELLGSLFQLGEKS